MTILWMHTYAKTHQNVYFKYVLFITCQLSFIHTAKPNPSVSKQQSFILALAQFCEARPIEVGVNWVDLCHMHLLELIWFSLKIYKQHSMTLFICLLSTWTGSLISTEFCSWWRKNCKKKKWKTEKQNQKHARHLKSLIQKQEAYSYSWLYLLKQVT